jgi:hypothetical protein
MTTQTNLAFQETPRRQFTLAGLLSFMLGASVYCSMITSVIAWVPSSSRPGPVWPVVMTVLTAWCVLRWLYRRWRLPQATRVHLVGPVIVIWFLVIAGFVSLCIGLASVARTPPESFQAVLTVLGDALQFAFFMMLYACGASTAVSLPAATLMLLYLMLQPSPSISH